MKLHYAVYGLPLGLLLAGCSQPTPPKRPPVVEQATVTHQNATVPAEETAKTAVTAGEAMFAPAKTGILPLTEWSNPARAGQNPKVNVFVTLLDAFGCQMKAPGVWRFELYEFVPRSAQLKGRQLILWPNIDLTSPAENHRYWRDFLRAYEFELDAQVSRDKPYLLEATCLCPDGRRLSCQYTLKAGQ